MERGGRSGEDKRCKMKKEEGEEGVYYTKHATVGSGNLPVSLPSWNTELLEGKMNIETTRPSTGNNTGCI